MVFKLAGPVRAFEAAGLTWNPIVPQQGLGQVFGGRLVDKLAETTLRH